MSSSNKSAAAADSSDSNDDVEANETRYISAAILFIIFMLVVNEYALNFLKKFKDRFPKLALIQGVSLTTLLGIFAGVILNITQIVDIVKIIKEGFSEFFLIILLPPILYESAINMERKYFFKNFGSILGYAILGTAIAIFFTAFSVYIIGQIGLAPEFGMAASFAFGSLISATDPVAVLSVFKELNCDKNLFALIFGESILNDAVSLIVYNTTLELRNESSDGIVLKAVSNLLINFFGSIFVGLIIGVLTALILKHRIQSADENHKGNSEMTILFLIPWVSYLVAEGLNISGIVSIMFCGIAVARYALPNVSESSRKLNHRLFNILAYAFDNVVSLLIGIGFVCFNLAWKEMGVSMLVSAFIVINIARYFNVAAVTWVLNKHRSNSKIDNTTKFFMWFSGFRGAMAYALSLNSSEEFTENSYGRIMLTITLFYAIINFDQQQSAQRRSSVISNGIDSIGLLNSNNSNTERGFWNKVRDKFVVFDAEVLKKYLLRSEETNEDATEVTLNKTPVNIELKNNRTDEEQQQEFQQGIRGDRGGTGGNEDSASQRRQSIHLNFDSATLPSQPTQQDDYDQEQSNTNQHKINQLVPHSLTYIDARSTIASIQAAPETGGNDHGPAIQDSENNIGSINLDKKDDNEE